MELIDQLKSSFKSGTALTKLILINLIVFVVLKLLSVFLLLFKMDLGYLDPTFLISLPASFGHFLFRPWTLITYMFMHDGFMHILFNMLWFYWFGLMFQNWYSQRQLIGLYLFGGIAGGLLYMLAYNLLPYFSDSVSGSIMVGASASIMAVVVAVAATQPNQVIRLLFIGNIKLKYVAILTVLLDLLMITDSNAGGHIAHLGGALIGLMYVRSIKSSRIDITLWISSIGSLFRRRSTKPKMKVKYQRPVMNDRQADYQYNQEKTEKQKQIDRILEKIKKSGYDSLSKEEKQTLFDAN